MDELLKKIDEIRDRINVSYSEAKEALEKNGGSVVDAIISLEKRDFPKENIEKAKNAWQDMKHEVKGVVEKTKTSKIRVMKDGEQVAEVPAAAGVLGLLGALAVPGLAAIGAIGSVAALMNKYSLEVEKNSDAAEDNAVVEDGIDNQK